MYTKFAPPERTSEKTVTELFKILNETPLVGELVNKTTDLMFVLDKNRQIVFTNKALIEFLGCEKMEDVLGKRPGEALKCEHSRDDMGCGTTEFCIQCGAVNAILNSQNYDIEAKEECLLSVSGGASIELMVIARPFKYAGHRFTFFTAKDISDSKRSKAIEKVFFHDIMNLASGIYSILDLFKDGEIEDVPDELFTLLHQSSYDMVREISGYRTLILAEKNELQVIKSSLTSEKVIENAVSIMSGEADNKGVVLETSKGSCSADFMSDSSLVSRILIDMLKNAVEASSSGERVSVWCEESEGSILFHVNNPAVMNPDVKLQIFKRTFTTKSGGKGLGTYSIKLLSEQYLGGGISFTSQKGAGTTFTFSLPV